MSQYILKRVPCCFALLVCFVLPVSAEPGKALSNGRLAVCPDTPNCISTENGELAAVNIAGHNPAEAWQILQDSIAELGGKIEVVRDHYLWASFKTPVFKFVDDVEARLDLDAAEIHLRSASREGYYDFNANSKRLKHLINAVSIKLNPERLKNIHY